MTVKCEEKVNLAFALRYLNMFNKANTLSDKVQVHLSNEAPLTVNYSINDYGHLKFYLAPKITEDE